MATFSITFRPLARFSRSRHFWSLKTGASYGQSYYMTVIGHHTYHMEWYHVWWPSLTVWLTSKRVARFVSDSCSSLVSTLIAVYLWNGTIGPWLLWNVNRKLYAIYQMVTFSMTLTDPKPGFQGHCTFDIEYRKNGVRVLRTKLLYRTLIGNHT